MKVKLNSQYWNYVKQKLESGKRGEVDSPSTPNKTIYIDPKLVDEEELEVNIHEAMHALDWTKDEHYVTEHAKELARYLWRLGYRKVE